MIVSDLMSAPVYIASPSDMVAYARNLMLKRHISRIPIVDSNHLSGIVTKKDIGYCLQKKGPIWRQRSPDSATLASLMTQDPITISPGAGVRDAITIMTVHDISGLPVIEQGAVVGMFTKADVLSSELMHSLSGRVQHWMSPPILVSEDHSLDHVIDLMRSGHGKVFVTNSDGNIGGVISETNLAFYQVRKEIEKQKEREPTAGKLMTSPVICVRPDDDISEAVRMMQRNRITCVCVTRNGDVKGIVTRDDIIREVIQ